jgi:hypothetical protein
LVIGRAADDVMDPTRRRGRIVSLERHAIEAVLEHPSTWRYDRAPTVTARPLAASTRSGPYCFVHLPHGHALPAEPVAVVRAEGRIAIATLSRWRAGDHDAWNR